MAWRGLAVDPLTDKISATDLPDSHKKGAPGGVPGLDGSGNLTGIGGAVITAGSGSGGGNLVAVVFDEVAGAWPAYSTDPNIVRWFSSPNTAPAPAHYNPADQWIRRPV